MSKTAWDKRITRRTLLKESLVVTGGVLALPLLQGCATGQTPAQTAAPTVQTAAPNGTAQAGTSQTPTTAGTGQPQKGGTLKISMPSDARTLGFPPNISSINDQIAAAPAMEPLAHFDDSLGWAPVLATSWDLDADAKTITLQLRQGVKFHDGTDFNAEAAKWNIEKGIEAKRLVSVDKAEVVDDHTVKLTLAKWDITQLDEVLDYRMMSPSAYESSTADDKDTWAVNNPVGTGPFKFVSWERDVAIKYARNENYWQEGKPYLDAIEFYPIADNTVRISAFQTGEQHVAFRMSANDIPTVESAGKVVQVLKTGLGAAAMPLYPDSGNENSPFADLKVRQAVAYAINRKEISDALFAGLAEPMNQWTVSASPEYNQDIVGTPYDPEKAKQLLAEAGYPNGFETILNGAEGNNDFLTAIQSYLAAVGIQAKINVLNSAAYEQLTRNAGWEGLALALPKMAPNSALEMRNGTISPEGVYVARCTLHPEDVLEVLDQALSAPDEKTKIERTKELAKLVFDKYQLIIPVVAQVWLAGKDPSVQADGLMVNELTTWYPADAWIKA